MLFVNPSTNLVSVKGEKASDEYADIVYQSGYFQRIVYRLEERKGSKKQIGILTLQKNDPTSLNESDMEQARMFVKNYKKDDMPDCVRWSLLHWIYLYFFYTII